MPSRARKRASLRSWTNPERRRKLRPGSVTFSVEIAERVRRDDADAFIRIKGEEMPIGGNHRVGVCCHGRGQHLIVLGILGNDGGNPRERHHVRNAQKLP